MKDKITLGHGSGGKLTQKLIQNIFIKHFPNTKNAGMTDSAVLPSFEFISFTTDSFVVFPLFFPGGNIGKLAVCGTINDLAVSGATPKYISASFIIEEGFPISDLEKIAKSMANEARRANISIVTGDTKVVNKGKCDGVFINTAGIGFIQKELAEIGTGKMVKPGDKIIVNGEIGNHGIAILSARETLTFKSDVISDCNPLNHLIANVLEKHHVHFMRDATRGGLATVICELAQSTHFGMILNEESIPMNEEVQGACEIFGYDPLYMANEGKVVMVVDRDQSDDILKTLKKHPLGKDSAIIGEVSDNYESTVILNTQIGGKRIIDMLAGEQLPRIC